jgi:DNA-binding protein HU-beta
MNKTELIEKIAAGAELDKTKAKKALEATLDAIKNALVEGDSVQLIGFGTFSVNERPAREGINLHTKEKLAAFDRPVGEEDLIDGKYLLVQRGKKNYYLITVK